MSNYKKFDISYKLATVKEYLETSKTSKISMADFAYSKGLSDSTFNDWVIKFKRGYFSDQPADDVIEFKVNDSSPGFVKLSQDNVISDKQCTAIGGSSIRLTYKDLTLEFPESMLDRALEVMKRW